MSLPPNTRNFSLQHGFVFQNGVPPVRDTSSGSSALAIPPETDSKLMASDDLLNGETPTDPDDRIQTQTI